MNFIKINIIILKNMEKKIINYMYTKYIIYFNYLDYKKTKKIILCIIYIKKIPFLVHHFSAQKHQNIEFINILSLIYTHIRPNSYSLMYINIKYHPITM